MNTQVAGKIRPNQATNLFKHRLDAEYLASTTKITDSVTDKTERAKGVLYLLCFHLSADGDRASDEIITAAIRSVIADLDDVDLAINAHHSAVRDGGAA